MTFKEDYQALFEPLQPSQRLLVATVALACSNPRKRWRTPRAAAMCALCLLIAAGVGLQGLEADQNDNYAVPPADRQEMLLARTLPEQDPGIAMAGGYSEDMSEIAVGIPEKTVSDYDCIGGDQKYNCLTEMSVEELPAPENFLRLRKMRLQPAPPLNLWLSSRDWLTYFSQYSLWLAHWTWFK